METKKMTLKEAQEFVKNTKYLVFTKEQSENLQTKLFGIGCRWLHSGKTICHTEHPFLTVDESLNIRYRKRQYYTYFEENKNRYIETHHILNMELEQEQPKPKFDPQTLQDFQKVLYRYSNTDLWRLGFLEYYNETQNNKFWIIGQDAYPYEQCVPYNEETEKLKGTSKNAPEYYQIWK
jgi:hypothetical protein